jgi:hypothetical protein
VNYLRFSRDHPAFFTFIVSFAIFLPLSLFLFAFSPTRHSINLDSSTAKLLSFGFSLLFALCFSIAILVYPKSINVPRFVDGLGSVVKKKKNFSQGKLIITSDFNPLKIVDLQSLPKYASSSNITRFSGGSWNAGRNTGEAFSEKMRDSIEKNLVGNFYFEFFLPKADVKIKIPNFHYIHYLVLMEHNYENWKSEYYQYPELNAIVQKLPDWIKHAEIYQQGTDVLVCFLVERSFCLNNASIVYNELVKLKRELLQLS